MTVILPLPSEQGDAPASASASASASPDARSVALPGPLADGVPDGGTVLVVGEVPGGPITAEGLAVHHHVRPVAPLPLADATVDGAWVPLALDDVDRGVAVLVVRELFRVLRVDGLLVLTAAVWAEGDLGAVLFAAGFGIDHVETAPDGDGRSIITVWAHA